MAKKHILLIVLFLGMLLRFVYFIQTDYTVRAHDLDGHIDYIKYILEHKSIPLPEEGWQMYHPPVYYLLGALVYKLSSIFSSSEHFVLRMVQLMSVGLSILMLYYVYKFLKHFVGYELISIFALAFVSFLPGLIFLSDKINNDILTFTLVSISIYYSYRWLDDKSWRNIFILSGIVSLGVLGKANFLPFLFGLVFTILVKCRKYIFEWHTFSEILSFFIIVLVFSAWFNIRNFIHYHRIFVSNLIFFPLPWNVDDVSLPERFTTFKIIYLLRYPYLTVHGPTIQTTFWTFLYRTALIGDGIYTYPEGRVYMLILQCITVLGLIPLVTTILGAFYVLRTKKYRFYPLVWMLVIFFIFFIWYCIRYPLWQSQDFRYLCIILPIAVLHGLGVECLLNNRLKGFRVEFIGLLLLFYITLISYLLLAIR